MTEHLPAQSALFQIGIPPKEQDELFSISKIRLLKKEECFVSEGQIPVKFGILISGFCRYFYINDKGHEFTKGFIPPQNVLVSYSAMLHQTQSLFFIQAMEPSELLEVNYKQWKELQKQNSFWDKFLITALEKGYCSKEKRERELLLLDAESRYKIFMHEFPGLDKKVQLQVIASYLGIKPESLSRIRKKMNHLT